MRRCGSKKISLNSLAFGRCSSIFKHVIFKHFVLSEVYDSFCEIALRWMPTGFIVYVNIASGPGVVSVQAIIWNNVDPDMSPYMVPLGNNELKLLNEIMCEQLMVNKLSSIQNGRYFADDIFKCISCMKSRVFWYNFHWSLFLRVQLAIR